MNERRQEIMFGAAVLLIPIAFFLAVELVARVYWWNKDVPFSWGGLAEATAATPGLAPYRFRPGSSFDYIEMNALGLRGPELKSARDTKLRRIAFLGDSLVFGAELMEPETLPAQVAAKANDSMPGCQFEYVSFSGPAYSLSFIAQHWPDVRASVKPDLTFVISGSASEALATRTGRFATGSDAIERKLRNLFLAPEFIDAVRRRLSPIRILTPGREEAAEYDEELERKLQDMQRTLAGLDPSQNVIVVGHRGTVDDTAPAKELRETTRHLRQFTGLKSPEAAADVVARTIAAMRDATEAQGWSFIDPFLTLSENDGHFLSAMHLSSQGATDLADALLPELRTAFPECGES